MRKRPSSRLLAVDRDRRFLLFKFAFRTGPMTGQTFWATPGGGVDPGESFEDAARRELYEEVGLEVETVGPQVAQRTAFLNAPEGEPIEADERYFIVHSGDHVVSTANWTALEREVMAAHHWWSQAELRSTTEQVWPETLAEMLIETGIWA